MGKRVKGLKKFIADKAALPLLNTVKAGKFRLSSFSPNMAAIFHFFSSDLTREEIGQRRMNRLLSKSTKKRRFYHVF